MFPFDLTILVQDAEGWPDCDTTLGSFQAHIEVRNYDEYVLYFCKYFSPSLREWVRPASGSEQEAVFLFATNGKTGVKQITAEITLAIHNKRLGGMRRAA